MQVDGTDVNGRERMPRARTRAVGSESRRSRLTTPAAEAGLLRSKTRRPEAELVAFSADRGEPVRAPYARPALPFALVGLDKLYVPDDHHVEAVYHGPERRRPAEA